MDLLIRELQELTRGDTKVSNVYVYPPDNLASIAAALGAEAANPIQLGKQGENIACLSDLILYGEAANIVIAQLQYSALQLIQKSLQLPNMYNIILPSHLQAKSCYGVDGINELYYKLYTDLPRYKTAANYVLFNHCAATDVEIVEVLNFCYFAAPYHVKAYLMANSECAQALFDKTSVFAMNKAWLRLSNGMSVNFIEGFAEVHYIEIYKHLKRLYAAYEECLASTTYRTDFYVLVNESDYSPVTKSRAFYQIVAFVHRYFYNACSLEHLQFFPREMKALSPRFCASGFDYFMPVFSLKRKPSYNDRSYGNYLVKYHVARLVFARLMADVLSFFTYADLHDELLSRIDRLRSEQLAIIYEDNIEQNALIQQTAYLDKLSLIVQPVVGYYLDSMREDFIGFLRSHANFSDMIESFGKKISNFGRICPGLERFSLTFFRSQRSFRDARVCVPGFCFTDDFYNFFNIIRSENASQLITSQNCEYVAACCGAFYVHFYALSPHFPGVYMNALLHLMDVLSKRLSRTKALLLRFLVKPYSFPHFAVREEVARGRQLRPLEDVYAQEFSGVRAVLQNIAIYLLLCPENSQFLRICENYTVLRVFQPAGVSESVGGTYHYDCMLKDSQVGDALHYTLHHLSVVAFRYFIIYYCALILISSLVFKQYRGHGEFCPIISMFSTLEQDRFIYLICYISNSLNVICNVKGFTEIGAVGYVNVIFEQFMVKVKEAEDRDNLERLIMTCDFDSGITYLCERFHADGDENNDSNNESGAKNIKNSGENRYDQIDEYNDYRVQENGADASFPSQNACSDITYDRFDELVSQMRLASVRGTRVAAERVIYRPSGPSFGARIPQLYSSQVSYLSDSDQRFVDFARGSGRVVHRLALLCVEALELRDHIVQRYSGAVHRFYAHFVHPLQEMRNYRTSLFLTHYNALAGFLYLRNECQVDAFPQISADAALSQLVAFDGDSGVNCVIDEVLKLFCWVSRQFGGVTAPLTAPALSESVCTAGIGLETCIRCAVEPQTPHALLHTIPSFEYSVTPLIAAAVYIKAADSLAGIRYGNAAIIQYIPELAGTEAYFYLVVKAAESEDYPELQEYCRETFKYITNGENVDTARAMHEYYAELYDTTFNIDPRLLVAHVLLVAAYTPLYPPDP